MFFIDFHTHVYPDPIAPKAAESIRAFYELNSETMNGTVGTLLSRGDLAGTHKFVILPVSMRPDRTRHINDFILEQLDQQERFYGFGTVHAAMDNITEEVEYIMQKGLRGIKMHPDFQLFDIDDPRLLPVYEMSQGKLPIIFHTGDTRYNYSHPAKVRKILDMFPKLEVIAAHFGGYSMYEEAYTQLKDTECFFDVSSSLMFMEDGLAEKYINRYGAERFVYGSDYPLWDPAIEMQRFLRLKLTDAQIEQIAHKTAERILRIEP